MKIISVKDREEGGKIASKIIIDLINKKPDSALGLATGSSPESTYDELIKAYRVGKVSFRNVKTVNLDEYVGLSRSSEQSYRFFMDTKLFSHIDIEYKNTYLPNGMAENLSDECNRYDEIVESLSPVDLQLLGIGHNGHIGFNEPSDSFIKNTHVVGLSPSTISANSRFFDSVSSVPKQAITMGTSQIMRARKIVLLAFGYEKSEVLYQSLYGDITPLCPASILQKHDNLVIIADNESLQKVI